jgi:hypothetical protein
MNDILCRSDTYFLQDKNKQNKHTLQSMGAFKIVASLQIEVSSLLDTLNLKVVDKR